MAGKQDMYAGKDPRHLPAYAPAEVAMYLRLSPATLRSWAFGRPYPTTGGEREFEPLIAVPDKRVKLLSYTNLLELHVLRLMRQDHGLKLDRVRRAIDYLRKRYRSEHPLAEHDFLTDGLDLLVEKFGELEVASQWGQLPLPEVVKGLLRRIEREKGVPVRFYPLPAYRAEALATAEKTKPVVMAPTVAFGQPVVPGTGVKAEALFERFAAQEPVEEIALDFDLDARQVMAAVQWFSFHGQARKAA